MVHRIHNRCECRRSKKSSDSQAIGLTGLAAKSGALFRPGVLVPLLDITMGRSHSGPSALSLLGIGVA